MKISKQQIEVTLSTSDQDIRCECGSLLARLVDGQIELKCRKCKRVVAIAKVIAVNQTGLTGGCCEESTKQISCCQ